MWKKRSTALLEEYVKIIFIFAPFSKTEQNGYANIRE
jgi:hypothetical protein